MVEDHGVDEDLCDKCGLCCCMKVIVNPQAYLIDESRSCRFLGEDRKCTIYESRHVHAPWCMSAKEAYDKGMQPVSCPYTVKFGINGYFGPRKCMNRAEKEAAKSIKSYFEFMIERSKNGRNH